MAIIVLDRDGVINIDSPDYVKSAEEWQPISGSIEAIAALNSKGYQVYVATNQAGLARGLFSYTDLAEMHQKLNNLVTAAGGKISGIMYCPHHPDERCSCRKPKPGLLKKVEEHSGESLRGQCFVGDSLKDIQAAIAIEARPILVRTGNGQSTEAEIARQTLSVDVFDDLSAFASSMPNLEV